MKEHRLLQKKKFNSDVSIWVCLEDFSSASALSEKSSAENIFPPTSVKLLLLAIHIQKYVNYRKKNVSGIHFPFKHNM